LADVFISYKSERRKAAEHLTAVLESYGFSVWFDYQLVKGRDFGLQIDRKVRETKALVALWCTMSVASRWVAEEVDLAQQLGILVPVKIEPCDLPVGFRRQDYIDLSNWDGAPRSHQLDPLIEALERCIGRAASLDLKRAREYEATWRRFGAPPLGAFALEQPLEVVEAIRFVSPREAPAESAMSDATVAEAVALEHWQAIKGTSDPKKLREFMVEFSASKVARLARESLTQLESAAWARLPRKRTLDALRAFLAEFPDGANVEAANREMATLRRAVEAQALEAAKRGGTVEAVDNFLSLHANSDLAAAARHLREQLIVRDQERLFKEATRADSVEALDGFLARHPDSRFALEAVALRSGLRERQDRFDAAMSSNDPVALRVFLGAYPTGGLANKARAQLRNREPAQSYKFWIALAGLGVVVVGVVLVLWTWPRTTGANLQAAAPIVAPVAQRVVLYEEDAADPQGKRFVGSAIWRTEMVTPAPGQLPELAIRADIEVPETKLTMTLSLRRNTDKALPASHTIEIVFNLPADFPASGISNVPGLMMKQTEQTRGVPLAGLAVKVTNGFFLVALSNVEADRERNLQLLKERGWFDIQIVYNNNRRAILALEKGTPGERAFAEAFTAWRQ